MLLSTSTFIIINPHFTMLRTHNIPIRTFSSITAARFRYSVHLNNDNSVELSKKNHGGMPNPDGRYPSANAKSKSQRHSSSSSATNRPAPAAGRSKSANPKRSNGPTAAGGAGSFNSTKDQLDLSLLENAYKKYERISLNSLESTYLTSKVSPLDTSYKLKNYLLQNKSNKSFLDFKNFNYLPLNFGLNQNIKLKDPNTQTKLKDILGSFRNTPIKYCFAYGSSVFKQANNDPNKQTQTDLIMATTFPDHFHSLNLNKHNDHYSFLKKFGSGTVNKVQDIGPGVYFNPNVEINNSLVKYGVVSMEKVLNDLLNWNNLYLAGRLHKPVKILKDDARVRFINQENLRNATALSLLLLTSSSPSAATDSFTIDQLFEKITSLSYQGDIRTKIGGESPKKITNIVNGQFNEFQELYAPLVDIFANDDFIQFTTTNKTAQDGSFKVNDSNAHRAYLIENLPFDFKQRLYKLYATKLGSHITYSKTTDTRTPAVLDGSGKPQIHDIFKITTSFHNLNRRQSQLAFRPTLLNTDMSIYEYDELLDYVPTQFALAVASDADLHYNLLKALEQTVLYPSIVQSVKGIFTAGLYKSFHYALEKRKKYNQGKK